MANCDNAVHAYITGFVELLKDEMAHRLIGIYLYGSLAMSSYFPPKSDMDFIIVVNNHLDAGFAKSMNLSIARYAEIRPMVGSIECSVITLHSARNVPERIPYELHYSESWHKRILDGAVSYGAEQFDSDLPAHLMCVKKWGICLYGMDIDTAFGEVSWQSFLSSVLEDLDWIVEGDNICESPYYGVLNICESPYYGVLNICRVIQILCEKNKKYLSKYEGAIWGIKHLPREHTFLVEKALAVYSSGEAIYKRDRKTGGVEWDKDALLAFRDYARERRKAYE